MRHSLEFSDLRQLPTVVDRCESVSKSVTLSSGWQLIELNTHEPLTQKQVEVLSKSAQTCKLKNSLEGDWLKASMPAQVHDILLAHKRIEDPLLPDKAIEANWIAENDWLYRCDFQVELNQQRHYLFFRGLDTIAEIYLNGCWIAFHQSCYVPLRIEVTDRLKDNNVLLIRFYSPIRYLEDLSKKHKQTPLYTPHHFIRKPGTDFNSFLGAPPNGLIKMGIFDDVLLQSLPFTEILHCDTDIELLPPYKESNLTITIEGKNWGENLTLTCVLIDPQGNLIKSVDCTVSNTEQDFKAIGRIKIEKPELWWPRGYGSQPLYLLSVSIKRNTTNVDSITKAIAFRDINMPSHLEFTINGIPIKLYGANLAGPLTGMSYCWDSEKFKTLLLWAENANFNTLRLWGLSPPFPTEVFEEADRRGLLLWLDFYHEGGDYPESDQFRQQCIHETKYLIKLRKHHPSLLLYCGGNEVHQFYEMFARGQRVRGDTLFEQDYMRLCSNLDPSRPYLINSPYAETWANDPQKGDLHDWQQHFYTPGSDYPLFFSELCNSSAPHVKTLKKFISDKNEFWPTGFTGEITGPDDKGVPESWQHFLCEEFSLYRYSGPIGDFYTPSTPEGLVYRYGAADEKYIKQAIERYRRGRPADDTIGKRRCNGVLLWKFNDAFCQLYAAAIDCFNEPTMKYYALRRAFAPILISIEIADNIQVWVINDSNTILDGKLTVSLFDPIDNICTRETSQLIQLHSGISEPILALDEWGMISRQAIIYAKLTDKSDNEITTSIQPMTIERRCRFPNAKITIDIEGDFLLLSTDLYARCVELSGEQDGDEFGWFFEDNYFDLLPGQIKRVKIIRRKCKGIITAKAFYSKKSTQIEV